MPRKRPPKLRPRYVLGPSPDWPFEVQPSALGLEGLETGWPFDLQPTSKLDLERMEAAKSRVDAEDLDFRRLAKRLRKEAGRKQDGRDILADYLEGKLQQPTHRPKRTRPILAQQAV